MTVVQDVSLTLDWMPGVWMSEWFLTFCKSVTQCVHVFGGL